MILTISQIIVSILLVTTIILQMQGKGLAPALGGGEFYRSRRSLEKILVWATIILTVIFGVLSIVLLLPHK
ncbi:MAG TPA: preprotein translocase subunit SecG [Candidatus Saccharimonadales bacterium]|nr:preprotein translocase subunit SecG [Candidatus Saccharimonadales bacterium]